MIMDNEKTKTNYKLIITIILAILLVAGGSIFFLFQDDNIQHRIAISKKSKNIFEWPDTQMASLIPAPQSTNGHIGHSSEKRLSVDVYNVTPDDYLAFCEQCKTYSFHYSSKQDDSSFIAYDPTANRLDISYDVNSAQMTLCIRNDDYEKNNEFISADRIGLTMNVNNVTSAGCIAEFVQEDGNVTGELITGATFFIQKQNENGAWIENTNVYYADFTAEAYNISLNDVTRMPVSWDYICGTLENGHYRIVKDVYDLRNPGDYDRYWVYTEFDISDVDISASNDDYVRINDYTARYFSLLEECNVTEGYQTIGVHVAFVPEVGSFPIKQEIYQQVAYHALHIWDFYPEVNMFKYDILWDDKAKEPVMTITIDKSAIDNLESYYNSEKMFMEQGEEYAFDNCFTSVEETDETKSWRNTVVIDPNSPVP